MTYSIAPRIATSMNAVVPTVAKSVTECLLPHMERLVTRVTDQVCSLQARLTALEGRNMLDGSGQANLPDCSSDALGSLSAQH
eukprot:1813804-Pyramimonas_sp.AAC.1